ncbi:MAG: glycosyltransferase family 4 protein [Patescibacteria group bacterium]
MPKKIAIICLNLSWQAGGVRLIYSTAHAFKKLGHQVIIYAPEINELAYPDLRAGLDIRIIAPSEPINWQYKSNNLFMRIFEKIKRENQLADIINLIGEAMDSDFDIVNAHDFSYRLAQFYKNKNSKAKIIWTMNDPPYMYLPKQNFFYDFLSRLFNFYKDIAERKYFKFIDEAVVLIDRNKKWVEERGIKGKIVWSGLDFERFYASLKNISGKNKFMILGVGTLNKYRRFEDIVSAVRILREKKYDIQATIVCKNIWKENLYKEEILNFTRSEEVFDYVKFIFEGASDEELKNLYASSDFFVLPIHLPPPRDGFGWQLAPFESMAAGTPIIVSRKNDIVEALKDKEVALFVDPLSPMQIADAVESLIKNPELYSKIATAGQEFVKENMSWQKYAEDMLS